MKDIGYRIKPWIAVWLSPFDIDKTYQLQWEDNRGTKARGGNMMIHATLDSAKRSGAQCFAFYQIWKIYVGDNSADYFPPQLVVEQPPHSP